MSAAAPPPICDAIDQLLNGTLNDECLLRLNANLESSPSDRKFYLAYCQLHLELCMKTSYERRLAALEVWRSMRATKAGYGAGAAAIASADGLAAMMEWPSAASAHNSSASRCLPRNRESVWWRHPVQFVSLALALTLAFIGIFFAVAWPRWGSGEVRNREVVEAVSSRFIARITGGFEHRWGEGEEALAPRAHLAAGDELFLAGGLIEVTYHDGTRVILEGPCQYRLSALDRAFLDRGKVYVAVNEQGVGFTIETPTAVIEDLGTEFAVEVSKEGFTETVVMSGSVNLMPMRRGAANQAVALEGHVLKAGQAVCVVGGKVEEADKSVARQFVRNLPGRGASDIRSPPGGWEVDSPGQARIDWGGWPFSMRMIVPPRHDAWEERGLAPAVYKRQPLPQTCQITAEVVVRGKPAGAMAGIVVYDAEKRHYDVQIGVHRGEADSWEVRYETVGKTHAMASFDGGRVQLMLERRGGQYLGYYRTGKDQAWIFLGRLPEGKSKDLRAGMLTKSYLHSQITVDYLFFTVGENAMQTNE